MSEISSVAILLLSTFIHPILDPPNILKAPPLSSRLTNFESHSTRHVYREKGHTPAVTERIS